MTDKGTIDYQERKYFGYLTLSEQASRVKSKTTQKLPEYISSFLPIIKWLPKYNRHWFVGDMIAGLTVGMMVVPQSLAYAKLANCPVEYGLYSAFMGVMFYAFLGTSREISVGPTAVLSLLIGNTVNSVMKVSDYKPPQIAIALGFYCSIIALILGIAQLGLMLDLIPHPVIIGFTTGSACTIILTQCAPLLGIPNVNSNDPSYESLYNLFINISNLRWPDLVFGITSLFFLQTINFITKRYEKQYPKIKFLKIASNGITVIISTLIAFLILTAYPDFNLRVVKKVPQGFTAIGVPELTFDLFDHIKTTLIPVTLVMVLEHVALCKAFARASGYTIASSQELFALGTCNIMASFFGGFAATGSFSRSAVKSKSGVKTPMGGMWTGILVLLALWFLTPAFYYIPNATLAAIIISSAATLIESPKTVVELARVHPSDGLIVLIAVLVTFLAGAEQGIAWAVGAAFLKLLFQMARPKLVPLARISNTDTFVSIKHPNYSLEPNPEGVLILRPHMSLIFPSSDFLRDAIVSYIKSHTSSSAPPLAHHDKLWSADATTETNLPLFRALVLDVSTLNLIDASGLQTLHDLHNILANYHVNYNPYPIYYATNHAPTEQILLHSHLATNSRIHYAEKLPIRSNTITLFPSVSQALAAIAGP